MWPSVYHLSVAHQKEWKTHVYIKNIQFLYAKFYLVDSTEGRHVDSLPPDGTCTTNTGGILTRSTVDDGIDQDLEGILEVTVNILNQLTQNKEEHV